MGGFLDFALVLEVWSLVKVQRNFKPFDSSWVKGVVHFVVWRWLKELGFALPAKNLCGKIDGKR